MLWFKKISSALVRAVSDVYAVETVFKIGWENTQLVTFGGGDFKPAFGLFGGLRNELRYQALRSLPVEDLCNIGQHRIGFLDHVFRLSPGDMRGPKNVLEFK